MTNFIERCRHGFNFRAKLCSGFIDEINSLIGKETVGNIAIRKNGGGDHGIITNADTVMDFIAFFQAAKNGNCIFYRRLVYHNRLEAAFQGGIFFNIFLIFIQGRSPDATEFAASQHRLQQVSRIHRAF